MTDVFIRHYIYILCVTFAGLLFDCKSDSFIKAGKQHLKNKVGKPMVIFL